MMSAIDIAVAYANVLVTFAISAILAHIAVFFVNIVMYLYDFLLKMSHIQERYISYATNAGMLRENVVAMEIVQRKWLRAVVKLFKIYPICGWLFPPSSKWKLPPIKHFYRWTHSLPLVSFMNKYNLKIHHNLFVSRVAKTVPIFFVIVVY